MNRYISDLHFGHKNILKADQRPWDNVDDMDRGMIEFWNSTVADDDDVWILGDFTYRAPRHVQWYLGQLKGRKHLILGNHDRLLMEDRSALLYFESVDKSTEIVDEGRRVVLCHYPIAEWNGYYRGSWHVFGHIHGRKDTRVYEFIRGEERMLNCGAMVVGYRPAAFEELVEANRRYKV